MRQPSRAAVSSDIISTLLAFSTGVSRIPADAVADNEELSSVETEPSVKLRWLAIEGPAMNSEINR